MFILFKYFHIFLHTSGLNVTFSISRLKTIYILEMCQLTQHIVNWGTQHQFSENICPEYDLRSIIFRTFAVKFLACLPLLAFPV